QRLWFIDQLEGGSAQYNMTMAYRLQGELDQSAFTRAINTIIERHEILRTNYLEESGRPCQLIRAHVEIQIRNLDLSALSKNEQGREIQRLGAEEARRLFDLRIDPPLRLRLLKLASDRHVVLGAMHHIASDAWSIGIFFRELGALYTAYSRDQVNPLAAQSLQYADYATWQREWLQGETLDRQLNYWRSQLADIPLVHGLPLDRPRPPEQTTAGQVYSERLDATTTRAVERFCQQYQVTPFMFLQTAFALLISRYSNEQDVVMGTPIAGRTHEDTEGMIGFFVNSLVLRSRFNPDDSFAESLVANKKSILDAYTHQHIPFEMLVDELQPERTLSYSPLYQISFSLQTDEGGGLDIPNLSVDALRLEGITAIKFDLQLLVNHGARNLQLVWTYNTDLFDPDTIERLSDSLIVLIRQTLAAPQSQIARLAVLDDAERQRLLRESTGPVVEYPQDRYLHEWIVDQALSTPRAIAVKQGDEQLSYEALNHRANQLAHYLLQNEVGPDDRVAVLLDRCSDLMVALLGVLKTGAAYVPLAPGLPAERLRHMLEDCAAAVVLTHSDKRELLPPALKALFLDSEEVHKALARCDGIQSPRVDDAVDIDRLAYVIYTSGSTGVPKGVPITHRGLLDYCAHALDAYYDGHLDGSLVVTSHGFDITVPALFLPLLRGDYVELPPPDTELECLAEALSRDDAPNYLLRMTPVHAKALLAQLAEDSAYPGAHVMIIGGAQLTYDVVAALARHFPSARLYNHYGPTETAIGCALYPIVETAGTGAVPIGRAMANTCLYVLDRHGQLAPRGVAGELYIASVGISPGYLNDEMQTRRAFLASDLPGSAGRKIYKTGDIVRRRADGLLEFVGRVDAQVKVRGYRVE
ncbi:MAG: amino acid adenylation domain-containing protein, partial [Wenzhouxiangellaceae bacterium]